MAFKIRQLSRFASVSYDSSGTPKKCNYYNYATTDAVATVIAAGYFNDGRSILQPGDQIRAVCGLGGTVDVVDVTVKTVPATGNITVGSASGVTQLTDNSGGTAADTIAAIGDSYSKTEVANAIASLAAKVNALTS